ncbi:hypothetical protein BIW11_03486 [Tropilaelaps mercedesae]|uniref:Uncharacterized protein n=1 Tax=Tropilaelaps mercedesae TaxID=418985 RepID=A0A1V9XKG1_9ACAR|nr:hypothetical protein BIW11_03486 [Tropilaelaps mercedesae]
MSTTVESAAAVAPALLQPNIVHQGWLHKRVTSGVRRA